MDDVEAEQASGGQVGGADSRGDEQQRGAGKRPRAARRNSVQQAAERGRGEPRDDEANDDAEQRHARRPVHGEPDNAGCAGAQREANPQFLRRLRHDLRHYPVDPDHRQEQRAQGEGTEQLRAETPRGGGGVNQAAQWTDVRERQLRIDLAQGRAEVGSERGGIAVAPDDERQLGTGDWVSATYTCGSAARSSVLCLTASTTPTISREALPLSGVRTR